MTFNDMKKLLGMPVTVSALGLMLLTAGCDLQTAAAAETTETVQAAQSSADSEALTEGDIPVSETVENSEDGGHAILADGKEASYSNLLVNKTGEAEGDEADFYGENAAVFATNGGTLDLSEVVVKTDGTHANGVFSYGEGSTVTISDSYIETLGNCSGGLMTTGGGAMNAENLSIHTYGNSSAAIRSDRGGGTVKVTGGSYITEGTGSPVVYSTADITVSDAELVSTASQGIVVEGQNSVTLNNAELTADNNTKNSDKSDTYQAVMIYQSMSGDADEGLASFTMNGGSLTNKNGDVFFVNNTVAQIDLKGTEIVNEGDGVFLRAAAAGWGSEGSNGGQVTLNAAGQEISGDLLVDSVSTLNLYLSESSRLEGAINPDGAQGDVYVELSGGSTWTLTGDSYISSLSCEADSIDCNGYTLYVDGTAYTEGSASQGSAVEAQSVGGGHGGGGMSQGENGQPPEMPASADGTEGNSSRHGKKGGGADGSRPEKPGKASGSDASAAGGGAAPQGEPPAMPDGDGSVPEGEPPAKPTEDGQPLNTTETGAETEKQEKSQS